MRNRLGRTATRKGCEPINDARGRCLLIWPLGCLNSPTLLLAGRQV